uniref:MFS domain-containing protein n=1 Tax=Syphacia muris TaxID=451379 RepID=A0A0N5A854_9BILA
MRGAFSFLCEIGYGAMCLLGMILGMRSVLGTSLTRLLGTSIIPQIFFITFLCFIPETPKYLMITKNNRKKALKSLNFFQGEKKENDALLDRFSEENKEEADLKRSSVKEVVTTWYLLKAVILGVLVIVLSLSFFPVLQSSTYFFKKANITDDLAELWSTLLMVLMSMSSISGSFLIDRYPRRTLLLLFGSLQMFFLSLFVLTSSLCNTFEWMQYACLVAMGFFIVVYSMVIGPMSWFISSELVHQRHRSTVFCLCFTVGNILIAVTNFLSIPLYEWFGSLAFIPLYIIPSILSLIYLYFNLPESRNREPQEIVAELRGKSKKDELAVEASLKALNS